MMTDVRICWDGTCTHVSARVFMRAVGTGRAHMSLHVCSRMLLGWDVHARLCTCVHTCCWDGMCMHVSAHVCRICWDGMCMHVSARVFTRAVGMGRACMCSTGYKGVHFYTNLGHFLLYGG